MDLKTQEINHNDFLKEKKKRYISSCKWCAASMCQGHPSKSVLHVCRSSSVKILTITWGQGIALGLLCELPSGLLPLQKSACCCPDVRLCFLSSVLLSGAGARAKCGLWYLFKSKSGVELRRSQNASCTQLSFKNIYPCHSVF